MRMRVLAAGAAAVLAVVGCGGPKGEPVGGNVVIGGKAYNPEVDGDLNVGLSAEGTSGSYTGRVQPDGMFKIMSDKGEGVPPGKYKVAYTRYPSKEEMSKLKGPPSPKNKDTGEVWDVAAGKTFTLDMSKAK